KQPPVVIITSSLRSGGIVSQLHGNITLLALRIGATLLRLESVVFECGCDIRWVQLWQQRGDAALHTQQLYCKNGASKIRLHNMYIHNCEISVSHSSLLVMEGDNVTVSCNGSGAPLPEVDWTVNDLHSINTHLVHTHTHAHTHTHTDTHTHTHTHTDTHTHTHTQTHICEFTAMS
ncbi:hypothetical protein KUCAC02_029607, partial [Chaenocephalus aceratus]